MTAKEKVRQAKPESFAVKNGRGLHAWQILVEVSTLRFPEWSQYKCLGTGRRESWAWAEAARNLNL